MKLPATQSSEKNVLSTAAALASLTAMVRGEQAFDPDQVERIEALLRALPDGLASSMSLRACLTYRQYCFNKSCIGKRFRQG